MFEKLVAEATKEILKGADFYQVTNRFITHKRLNHGVEETGSIFRSIVALKLEELRSSADG